ncbi:MAG: T9SS type A sorting domain-containing protein [Bacteroidia bacterium]|nr:T9SS type A sorting domain-containing protein [Bacteroidia bacterium]
MKKHLFSLCGSLLAGVTLHAQTITASDMPSAGSTFVFSTVSVQDMQNSGAYLAAGNGINWDLSSFAPSGNDTDAYVTPGSVNGAYSLFFGFNAFGKEFAGNIGGGMLPISIEDIYDFYDVQSNQFRRKGIGMTITGLPFPALYTQPDIVYELPLSFSDTYTHPFEFQLAVPTLGTLKRNGVRTSVVDGSGTLITPAGTYNNCLRVRSEITQVDSIMTQFGNFGFPSESVEYTWLEAGTKAPVFSVTETGAAGQSMVTEAKYMSASLSTSVENCFAPVEQQLFPNPATDLLQFTIPVEQDWQLIDMNGRLLRSGKATGMSRLDISTLEPGTYFFVNNKQKHTFIKQ